RLGEEGARALWDYDRHDLPIIGRVGAYFAYAWPNGPFLLLSGLIIFVAWIYLSFLWHGYL
ncbi:MAG: hypothetical protein JSV29_04050, partial [Candidatus Bathyarchaeota archaeon]